MNGPQHFTAAEEDRARAIEKRSPMLMDSAMVHALLALTAATALPAASGMPVPDCDAWEAAVSISAQRLRLAAAAEPEPDTPIYDGMTSQPAAEPLVTCPAATDEGTVRCCLPVGHDGPHQDDYRGETALMWSSDADLAVIGREDQADEPADRCGADGPPEEPDLRCTEAEGHAGHHAASGVAWSGDASPALVRPFVANF